ncbi:zinc-dependent alcohol dehydrogenase family protein [Pleurocapsales cyanobacterium LEGE 06147]|nr:zinc-dependent alcohol dehydrogenase family protein [Pleurocapsales cyanobacterium LEGE 06147]
MPKIVRFHAQGAPEVLQIEELPLTEPGKDEVRLQVKAIGLNRAEVMFREGAYLETPNLPARIGYEASGIVDAVGAEVDNIRVGDRVSTIPAFSMNQYGVYGESAIVPARAVAHYPDNLSWQEGAAIWMQYLTAYGALIEYGQMQSGNYILITAASSSVGHAAIQLAKAVGATAIATTRTSAKKQKLLDDGADYVIATQEEDLPARIMEIASGHGADLIFDPVAGSFVTTLAEVAAPGATIFIYGVLSREMDTTPFPLMSALQKGLKIQGYTLFEITTNPEKLERGKSYVYDGLKSGVLKPALDPHTFTSLDEIVEAHRYMESNQQNGKIVVTV